MSSLASLADRDVIKVEPWRDPVVEALGHDPRSLYVETFWLPVLGPSTTWLLRRLAACLEASPTTCAINLAETSRALGLGDRSGRNAPFMRAIARTIDFEMARLAGPGAIGVRTVLPPLARRHLARLPQSLRDEHELLERTSAATSDPSIDEMRRRGRQLALSLVDLGEDEAAAERQLMRWRFHPALARECARWAAEARSAAAQASGALAAPEGIPVTVGSTASQ
ncbi:MAG: hypothetical protein JWO62_3537 [Acidimicrobiaceae bacterium]|jgi:hypothetical protein|nr:hypothetical protein [Acidimicrobiaceae bacterium]